MAFLDHFAMGNVTSRFTSIVDGAASVAPIRSRRNSLDVRAEDTAITPTAPSSSAVNIHQLAPHHHHQGSGSSPIRGLGFAGLLQSLKPKRKDRGSQDSLYPTSCARDEDRDRAFAPSSSSSGLGGGLSVPGPAAIAMFSSSNPSPSDGAKFIPPSPSRSRAGKMARPASSSSLTRAPSSYAHAHHYEAYDAESTPTSMSTSDILGHGLGMIGLGGGVAGATGTGAFAFSIPIPLPVAAHKERDREREIDLTDSPRSRAVSIPRVVRTAASESPSPPPTPKPEINNTTASSILGLKRSGSGKSVKSKSGSPSPARQALVLPPSRSTAKPKGLSPPRRAGVSVQARQDDPRGRASPLLPLPLPAGHGHADPRMMVWDGVASAALLPPYESKTATEALLRKNAGGGGSNRSSAGRSRSPNAHAYTLRRKESGDRGGVREVDAADAGAAAAAAVVVEGRKAGRRLSFSKILHPTRATPTLLDKAADRHSDVGRKEQHLHMAMSVSGLALSSGYLSPPPPASGSATSMQQQLRPSRSPSRNQQQESTRTASQDTAARVASVPCELVVVCVAPVEPYG
ncbi:hypothetical protein BKA62DRAFT_85746 [Auriculariales sp. MPI-PUGE-AT-0066]|nr:hypothetical protein BKA62DRAFT_85746 [Auriculariales sp. MPI-PUGE-AT-0066]